MTSIAVAIVNYNTREHLRACLASVQTEAPSELIVVDNASSDGSAEMVQSDPRIVLHAIKSNVGYGAAANWAIFSCNAEYVLLLNSDTSLHPGTLQALCAYLDRHPHAAIVGPNLVNPDETFQPSCFPFPTPLNVFLHETSLGLLARRVPLLRGQYLPAWSHAHPRAVPWVLGAALAIRREAFEAVGGFDESFFMYYEEVDLCYRLHAIGWQIHFAPVATVVHVKEASTLQRRADMTLESFASLMQFYRRHYSGWQKLQLRLILTYLMLRNITLDTIRMCRIYNPHQRGRLSEDRQVWHAVLRETWHS